MFIKLELLKFLGGFHLLQAINFINYWIQHVREKPTQNQEFLNDDAILHIVDSATPLLVAQFLDAHGQSFKPSVEVMKLAFMNPWRFNYIAFSNRPHLNLGAALTSEG